MSIKKRILTFLKKNIHFVKTPIYVPVSVGSYLKNRNVLITGGTGGIGYSIAKACLLNGACVVITGRNKEKLDTTICKISQSVENSMNRVFPLLLDLKDIDSFQVKLNSINKILNDKPIDTLVNCAGISSGNRIGNTNPESFDEVIDTNLRGTYFLSQTFSNYLIENKIEGNILIISSSSGVRPAISPYMISKWGEIGLTQGLAKKLIKYGIVVNGIAPGPTATSMIGENGLDLMYAKSPAQRYADPEEIANIAVFLVSDMGRMIVGDTVFVTGGCGTLTFDDIEY